MVEADMRIPKDVVERNIKLAGELMAYLHKQPQLFDSLPENFELVILPDNDPEIRRFNLELLDAYGSEGKPIVFARIHGDLHSRMKDEPILYIPVAA